MAGEARGKLSSPGSQDEEIRVIEVLPLTRSSRINQNRARKAIELWQHKVDR
jgi:hypothetical protein